MEKVKSLVSKIEKSFYLEIENHQKETEPLVRFNAQLKNLSRKFFASIEPKPVLRYCVDSLFLREVFTYLVAAPEEALCLATGVVVESNLFILDRFIRVTHQASIVSAKADIGDLFTKLIALDEKHGHQLLAILHSHPFSQISGTVPSSTDLRLTQNLENSGYETIQAIFSRDAFIRFFSNRLRFDI